MNKIVSVSLLVLGGVFANAQQVNDSIKRESKIEEVELFGERKKQPEGLEAITRLPLKPRDQIQSISVISYKAIEALGALTVTDVAKNVPGVTQFGSYGGIRESMSIRGYRGVPVLKNGVQMDSDFRTGAMLTDMQGVESIQVIKGSAAVTQGIGDGLGAAGGVINVVTKVPKFINQTNVGFRYGSWDFYRPTIDFQRVLDSQGKVAVRLNAAYQDNNSFRRFIHTDRIYVNPSIAIRPDDKTEIVVEMDYMHNNTTPDRGTVNLAKGDTEAIYRMPGRKFLGFASDNAKIETFNFSTTATRKLTEKLKLRAAFMSSSYQSEIIGAALAPVNNKAPNEFRKRTLTRSDREDLNKVFQFDFIGADVMTGFMKHTFQVGFDWKESNVTTTSYQSKDVDQINVLQDINNFLPNTIDAEKFDLMKNNPIVNTITPTMGLMAQDVITFNKYIKAHLGVRYSRLIGSDKEKDYAWNPSLGIMISPVENMNVFGSYTSTTSLRSSNSPLAAGGTVGASTTKQWEAGIKSDWLNERLRFNVTFFDIKTDNLSYEIIGSGGNGTGRFALAGELKRKGMEVELIGKILPNLQVMTGWAYVDAQYQDSPSFVNGSAPINTPKHSANAWLNYKFNTGALEGLDVGAGIYYVGNRPVDDYKLKAVLDNGHVNGTQPDEKPFNMPDYTTVDAQIGYTFKNGLGLRGFFNNIFDSVGYNSYFRGGYIDQIQPRNFAVQVNYKF